MNVIGEIVAANLDETARLEKWAKAKNPWRRRAAIASTTELNQKGRKHAGPTLDICNHVMTEKDTGVRKAVGWALREATKSEPEAVFEFLLSWRDRAERRILNEGSQKLSAERRKSLLD
jgi:3-methyladenine DNA glycosylase AlkD